MGSTARGQRLTPQKGEHMERSTLVWWYVYVYYKGNLHDTRRYEFATEARCLANDINTMKDWNAKVRKVVQHV